ncbi:MAG: YqjF family protein, partial [Vicinamibacteria bacterium]
MTWRDLAFVHWPVAPESLRGSIPSGLTLDTFQGDAWLGVVPFRMTGVRPRGVPPIPGLSSIVELNVRTYVVAEEKPGVWFYSLDATSRLAVRGARVSFHLPYFDARMSVRRQEETIHYRSERTHRGAPKAHFVGSYRPKGSAGRSNL